MSVEDARELYEAIGEDESLQSGFEELETQEEIIERTLEVAENQGFDVGRADVETLLQEIAEEAGELDESELENVAGGWIGNCEVSPSEVDTHVQAITRSPDECFG